MNSYRLVLFSVAFVAAVAVFFTPLFAGEEADEEESCRIYIAGIVGECEMALDPAEEMEDVEWEEAGLDVCLSAGDLVRTKKESLMAVAFGEEKEVRLNALSMVRIEEPDEDEADQIMLTKGHLYAKVTGKKAAFSVRTPSAIAGVRGTEFDVEVDEEEGTKVHVLEGEVAVFNELGEVLAKAGMATEILKGKLPLDPFEFDIDEYRKKIEAWKDKIQVGKVVEKLKEEIEEKKEEVKDVKKDIKKKVKRGKFKF